MFYLWVFLLLEVLRHIWIKVLCVSLVQTVDFPLFLDLHVSVNQDELADRLQRDVRSSWCIQIHMILMILVIG